MANVRFVPDYSGYRAILDSGPVQGILDTWADGVTSAANSMLDPDEGYRYEDFESGEFTTKTGAAGRYVRTKTDHARYSQNKNYTLSKAFYSTGI